MKRVQTFNLEQHSDQLLSPLILHDKLLLPNLVCRGCKRQLREVILGDKLAAAGPSGKQLGIAVFMPALQEGLDSQALGRQVSNRMGQGCQAHATGLGGAD